MADYNKELLKVVRFHKKQLDHYTDERNFPMLLQVINKLRELPITTVHLEETLIGKAVNVLTYLAGDLGDAAESLVTRWKEMVLEGERRIQRYMPSPTDDNGSKVESPDGIDNLFLIIKEMSCLSIEKGYSDDSNSIQKGVHAWGRKMENSSTRHLSYKSNIGAYGNRRGKRRYNPYS